ncbi:MAG: Ig-like domain-containing protein [Saprospiraceae bacterium]|nr:Ig-like domain-containing protein [Saprospiraceae bacterium]
MYQGLSLHLRAIKYLCWNTTNILPSSGGVWTSSNNAIATINSNGLITGISAGVVTFNYTDNGSGLYFKCQYSCKCRTRNDSSLGLSRKCLSDR